MQITKKHKIIISAVAVIVLLGIYVTFDKRSQNKEGLATNSNQETSTTTSVGNIKVTSNSAGYTINQVPVTETKTLPQPIPDLSRPVTYGNVSLTAEEKTAVSAKITQLQTMLKTDASNHQAWLDLGIYQKMTGDYTGAILSWQYASKLVPTDYIALANLGNLYGYYLKDSAKAESYYKQAISKGPTQAYLYTQLADLYKDVFQDPAKAKAIVDQGLSKLPNDPNLLQLQTLLK